MDAADLDLRNRTYRLFVELGRAPELAEVAADAGLELEEAARGWRRLHEAHALVLRPGAAALLMANPFSAVPTEHRVHAAGRWWFANCAWDAFGVCAALGSDGAIETRCPDCGDVLGVAVVDRRPDDESLVFGCRVPARHWWDDIVHT